MASDQQVLMRDAIKGFEELLNNDINGAQATFAAHPESCWHLLGAGTSAFLCAALGMEDSELYTALGLLQKGEALAVAQQNGSKPSSSSSSSGPSCWPTGTEYKLAVADSVITQALVLILTESYVEYVKALYRLNKAHKLYQSVQKLVLPEDIGSSHSLEQVFASINAAYTTRKANPIRPTNSRAGSSFFSWGRKKDAASSLRTSLSTTSLPRHDEANEREVASVPASRPDSPPIDSMKALSVNGSLSPAWKGDQLSTFIISGSAFGTGLFTLIFSLLPSVPAAARDDRFRLTVSTDQSYASSSPGSGSRARTGPLR